MRLITDWWNDFRWSTISGYIDGWFPKASIFIPIFGYLILFNDEISELLEFTKITIPINEVLKMKDSNDEIFECTKHIPNSFYEGLKGVTRLKFIYFGFFFLATGNIIYRLTVPAIIKIKNNADDFAKYALSHYVLDDYSRLVKELNKSHISFSTGETSHVYSLVNDLSKITPHYNSYKKYEDGDKLIHSIKTIFRLFDESKNVRLKILLMWSTLGYLLLLIPSGDLFIKVVMSFF